MTALGKVWQPSPGITGLVFYYSGSIYKFPSSCKQRVFYTQDMPTKCPMLGRSPLFSSPTHSPFYFGPCP